MVQSVRECHHALTGRRHEFAHPPVSFHAVLSSRYEGEWECTKQDPTLLIS